MAFTWSKNHTDALVCGRTPTNPLYLRRKENDKGVCEFKAVNSLSTDEMALCVSNADAARNHRWIEYDPLAFEPRKAVLLGVIRGSPVYLARIRRQPAYKEMRLVIVPGYFILTEGVAIGYCGWLDHCVDTKFQVLVDCSDTASSSQPPSYTKAM